LTLLAVSTFGWIIRIAVGLIAALLIYVVGASFLAKFKLAPDEEPDPEDVVPVDARFRCIVCGAEVVMTASQRDADVEAPRHCREDMVPID
jgi:hypothetical protein